MLIFTRSQAGSWASTTPVSSLETDVLAVNWISYTTIALGCRDGKIRLYDTRSGGSSHILTHPHPIAKIKGSDDPTRLLVSGLHDSLFLYDIRFIQAASSSAHYNKEYMETLYPGGRNTSKRRKMTRVAQRHWSSPILTIPHSNLDDLELDFDLHPRLGLVAAAQNSDSGIAVRVSNLWTGRIVKEFKKEGMAEGKKGRNGCGRIRKVKFIDDETNGGVGLWTVWNGAIAKFSW